MQEDPRVALPPQWIYKYFTQVDESNTPKEMLSFVFENVETKETSYFDPRLTPEALRERGVNLEEFVLVYGVMTSSKAKPYEQKHQSTPWWFTMGISNMIFVLHI